MTAAPHEQSGPGAAPRVPDRTQRPRPWRTQTAAAGLLSVAVVCLVLALFVL